MAKEPTAPKHEVKAVVYQKGTAKGILTADIAKKILGWEETVESPFLLSDFLGAKIICKNNDTNRPFRLPLAKRYANEVLRNKWRLNGETIVIDLKGKVQSGQHRLIGLILAEQMNDADPEKWEEYGWKRRDFGIETIIITGVSNNKDVVDTIDLGQKRTLGDVLYRNREFKGKDLTPKDQKRLNDILAGATRLAWIRATDTSVSHAPHFPHSEALQFMNDHPKLVECVEWIYNEESGTGTEGLKISRRISLPYAAALLYLMAASGTEAEGDLDFRMETKAQEFWTLFANGGKFPAGSPIQLLRDYLPKVSASSGFARDEIIGLVIKAFNAWVDNKKLTHDELMLRRITNEVDGSVALNEWPRLGGIDVELTEDVAAVEVAPAAPAKPAKVAAEPKADKPKKAPAKKVAEPVAAKPEGDTVTVKGLPKAPKAKKSAPKPLAKVDTPAEVPAATEAAAS